MTKKHKMWVVMRHGEVFKNCYGEAQGYLTEADSHDFYDGDKRAMKEDGFTIKKVEF